MYLYTATKAFSLPLIAEKIAVGDTIRKYVGGVIILINGSKYANRALYEWIGSSDSLQYMSFTGTSPDPLIGNIYGGSVPIIPGNSFVVVTGANFPSIPLTIIVTVVKPNSSDANFAATVRADSVTTDGFIVDLTGSVQSSGYLLDWTAVQ